MVTITPSQTESIIESSTFIPSWLLEIGAIAGLLSLIVTLIIYAIKFFTRPTLEVRLTKEVFFRLIEDGESLFANAVLLVKNGTVEVRNIYFKLEKQSGDHKEFNIEVVNFGKKILSENSVLAAHSFYSTSPLNYITDNQVERQLYQCVLGEKKEQIRQANSNFDSSINAYRSEILPQLDEINKFASPYWDQMMQRINTIKDESIRSIMDAVQVEDGTYRLTIYIEFKPLDKFYSFYRKTNCKSASIKFTIDDNFREKYRIELEAVLMKKAFNTLLTRNLEVIYPNYLPKTIEELES